MALFPQWRLITRALHRSSRSLSPSLSLSLSLSLSHSHGLIHMISYAVGRLCAYSKSVCVFYIFLCVRVCVFVHVFVRVCLCMCVDVRVSVCMRVCNYKWSRMCFCVWGGECISSRRCWWRPAHTGWCSLCWLRICEFKWHSEFSSVLNDLPIWGNGAISVFPPLPLSSSPTRFQPAVKDFPL